MKRVLLDENLPRRLARELLGFEVRTVQAQGWSGIKNGKLLRIAELDFDVFLTADKNLSFQQTLSTLDLGVVVVRAVSTKVEDLLPLVPALLETLEIVKSGQALEVGSV